MSNNKMEIIKIGKTARFKRWCNKHHNGIIISVVYIAMVYVLAYYVVFRLGKATMLLNVLYYICQFIVIWFILGNTKDKIFRKHK